MIEGELQIEFYKTGIRFSKRFFIGFGMRAIRSEKLKLKTPGGIVRFDIGQESLEIEYFFSGIEDASRTGVAEDSISERVLVGTLSCLRSRILS
jgi:hypothetical protein